MSTTVDNRVVEMRFDNKDFERNVATSMSTLEKLKRKLNMSGASKGLETLNKSVNNMDFSQIQSGVASLEKRFSTFGIMGMRAIENVTDSMMRFATKTTNFFTGGIIQGGITRAMNLENAHFQLQGLLKDESKVAAVMENVNDSVDGTAYSLDAAAKIASQLAASGMQAGDEMFTALRGVAGVAAMTNSSYEDIGRIYTQVAGQGRLMGDQLLQLSGRGMNAAATLAESLGKTEAEVREMVTSGEVSFEMFASAMDSAFGEHAKKANETLTGSMANVKSALGRIGAEFVAPLIEQNGPLVTFFNTLRERINDVKAVIGPLSDLFVNSVTSMTKSATNFLKKLDFSSKWDKFIGKVNDAGVSTEDFTEKLKQTAKEAGISSKEFDGIISSSGGIGAAFTKGKLPISLITDTFKRFAGSVSKANKVTGDMSDKLGDFQDVVNNVIGGNFGNGQERIDALTKAGYDNTVVQNLVNKVWEKNGKTWDDTSITAEDLAEVMGDLSAEELESLGYTKEQADALKDLAKQAEKTGTPLNELITDLSKPSGLTLVIDTFKNTFNGLVTSVKTFGSAWSEIFADTGSSPVYNIIEMLHSLSTHLVLNEEDTDKLKRSFKGLLAIIDIVSTLTGGALKIGLRLIGELLGMADLDVLDLTANLGDLIVKFRDFLFDNNLVVNGFKTLISGAKGTVSALKRWIETISDIPSVQVFIENVKDKFVELKDVGVNAVEGLKDGLEGGLTSIPNILMEIGRRLLNSIKNVLGIHSPSTEMYAIGENIIAGLINALRNGMSKVVGTVKEIGSKLVGILGDIDWNTVFAGGVSIGLVVIVKKLADTVSALASPLEGFGSILSGVGDILSESSKGVKKNLKSFSKLLDAKAFSIKASAVKDIAVAIAILAGSIVMLTKLDSGKMWEAVGAIGALATILGILSIAVGKGGAGSNAQFGKISLMLLAMSGSVLLLGKTIKLIGGLSPDQAEQGITGLIVILTGIMAVVTICGQLVSGESSKNIDKVGKMLRNLSISLLLMVGAIKLIGGLSEDEIERGRAAIMGFVGVVTLLSLISSVAGENANKLGSMMIKLSVSMILMVGVIKLISGLSEEEIKKGGTAILGFVGVVGLLSLISKAGGKSTKRLGSTFIAMSVSMLLMVGVIKLVSGLSEEEITKGGIAILAFVGIIGLLTQIVKKAGKSAPKIAATILAMSVAIGILAAVAILLGMINIEGLAKGIVAVGLLGVLMAAMIKSTEGAKDCKGNLIVMTVAIGVMAASVAALSMIDGTKLTGATLALTMLMGMFALMAKAAGTMNGAMGTLIVMTVVVGLLAGILYLLSGLPVKTVLGISASLSVLLLSLSGACLILAAVGATGPAAFVGVGALVTLIAAVGTLMVAIGALVDHIPQVEVFLDKGIAVLEKIGYGMGSFVGNIIGGFSKGALSGLPDIGTSLSEFMTNLEPFLEGAKTIDREALSGIGSLVKMMAMISGASILESIASWITGTSSMDTFNTQINGFADAIVAFSKKVSGKIDKGAVAAASNAGKLMAEMNSTIPGTGGVLQWFVGKKNMTDFGEQLVKFGDAIVDFSNTVSGSEINEDAITAAANAGEIMSKMQGNLEPTKGVVQWFVGEKNMADFGEQLASFGEAIADFSSAVSEKGIDEDAVTAAANAGEIMAKMQSGLSNSEGVLQWFTGEKNMADFGEQLVDFGEAIVDFSNAVSGNIDQDGVTVAANAGAALIELQKALPDEGFFSNTTTLEDFGKSIKDFGTYISDYASGISGLNTKDSNGSITLANRLKKFIESVVNLDTSGITKFKSTTGLGETLSGYSKKISGMDFSAVGNSVTTINRIVNAINNISNANTTGVEGFKTAISNLAQVNIGALIQTFAESSPSLRAQGKKMIDSVIQGMKTRHGSAISTVSNLVKTVLRNLSAQENAFRSSGKELIYQLIIGIKSMREEVVRASSNVTAGAASAPNRYYKSFYDAGVYLVDGFANGIWDNIQSAANAAAAMAESALAAARNRLEIASPSKVFYKIGDYSGLGFVNALYNFARPAYLAAGSMADSATKGFSGAIAKMYDLINMDIESQPTIRPVMDLGDIESGVSAISGMFNDTVSLGLATKAGTIGAMMNRNVQNGNSDDVVSAINKLSRKLDGRSGDVYTINGVTYDDGSNIADAVKSLIRAATIERRA